MWDNIRFRVFVSVSCLRVGLIMSSCRFHAGVSCLRVGFMSSCRVDHAFVSVYILWVITSSCRLLSRGTAVIFSR